jgi:HEAT repeat protein
MNRIHTKVIPNVRAFLFVAFCFALRGETSREHAWKLLKNGIGDKDAEKRAQAVSALGLIRGNRESIRLAENALADSSKEVREAAVTALGELDARSSRMKIKALLGGADAHTVITIAAVLRKFNDPEGYEIYYEILTGRRKGNGGILEGIKDKKSLEKMGFEEALGFVPYAGIGLGAYNYFKSNNASAVEATAATQLASDPDPDAKKALLDAVFSGKEVVRVAALRALAKRGDPAVVPDIAHQMWDKPQVSYTAAAAVVHLTDLARKSKT